MQVESATPGKVHVLLKVAGQDASQDVVSQIQQKIAGLAGVELVDAPAAADIALHVVIQEQTMGKRTIGFTASYVTGTPCVQERGDKKTDVELKGQLGVYTNPEERRGRTGSGDDVRSGAAAFAGMSK